VGCGAPATEAKTSFGFWAGAGLLAMCCSATSRRMDERESRPRILSMETSASQFSRSHFRISMALIESIPRWDMGSSG